MHSFILEFDNEKDARSAVQRLWEKAGITGELGLQPLGDGRWRLEVLAESPVRESTIEGLKGHRVHS